MCGALRNDTFVLRRSRCPCGLGHDLLESGHRSGHHSDAASLISIFILGNRDALKGLPCVIVLAVVLAVCATLTVTRTDLFFGGPALLYAHGTDHLGYATMADWMRAHLLNTPLTLPQDDVYNSYPDYL